MRLLLLDGGKALHAVVRRLVPADVEETTSFAKTLNLLRDDPPEAAIIDLTPVLLPWLEIQTLCSSHEPPIPVLFESCIHESPADAGLEALDASASFLAKPYHLADLQAEIDRLVGWARASAEGGRQAHAG
jgi:DNA-binding response OmpR family regulator